MINTNEFTNEVSPRSRNIIGFLCLVISLVFVVFGVFFEDSKYTVIALIVGVPLSLVALSIFFGAAKKGQGILSPFTLYVLGALICFGGLAGLLAGEYQSWVAFLVASGCFALAEKRKRS